MLARQNSMEDVSPWAIMRAVDLGLPWVLRMDGNPLGIDWRLEKQ